MRGGSVYASAGTPRPPLCIIFARAACNPAAACAASWRASCTGVLVGDLTMYKFKVYKIPEPLENSIYNPNIQDIIAPGIGELIVILKFKRVYFHDISVRCFGPGLSWKAISPPYTDFARMCEEYPDAEARNAAWYSELKHLRAINFKDEAEAEQCKYV
jgi:hypothetical protein